MNNKLKTQPVAVFGLAIAAILSPVVALYAPKGIVLLFIIASIASLYTLVFQKPTRPQFPLSFSLSIIALALWGVASLIWTVSFELSWSVARSAPFTLLGGACLILAIKNLSFGERDFISTSMVWGFSIGIILAVIDIGTDFVLFKTLEVIRTEGDWGSIQSDGRETFRSGFVINNGITVLAMFLWPVLIYLIRKKSHRTVILGFAAAVIIVVGHSSNFAAVASIATGFFGFLIGYFLPRHVHKLSAIGFTFLLLGAPFAIKALPDARTIGEKLPELSFSIYPRLVIWQHASNLVMEKPFIGHGIRTSRAINKDTGLIPFVFWHDGKIEKGNTKPIPLHPHNGVIQMWLELGGVGAIIGIVLVLSILHNIKNNPAPPVPKALLYSALISSMCLISVSYGLWQSWWMGLLWLQGAMILASLGPQNSQEPG